MLPDSQTLPSAHAHMHWPPSDSEPFPWVSLMGSLWRDPSVRHCLLLLEELPEDTPTMWARCQHRTLLQTQITQTDVSLLTSGTFGSVRRQAVQGAEGWDGGMSKAQPGVLRRPTHTLPEVGRGPRGTKSQSRQAELWGEGGAWGLWDTETTTGRNYSLEGTPQQWGSRRPWVQVLVTHSLAM